MLQNECFGNLRCTSRDVQSENGDNEIVHCGNGWCLIMFPRSSDTSEDDNIQANRRGGIGRCGRMRPG